MDRIGKSLDLKINLQRKVLSKQDMYISRDLNPKLKELYKNRMIQVGMRSMRMRYIDRTWHQDSNQQDIEGNKLCKCM